MRFALGLSGCIFTWVADLFGFRGNSYERLPFGAVVFGTRGCRMGPEYIDLAVIGGRPMGKSAFVDRAFFVGLVASGLLALIVTEMALSTGAGSSAAHAAYRATPLSMTVPSNGDAHNLDSYGQRQLPVRAQPAPKSELAFLPTLPPMTGLPTLPSIETLIPETPELSLPTVELPALPTVPPVLSSPVPESSATPTPTATPAESGTEQAGRRRLLLGGLGLAVLCGGGILVGVVLLFVLRRPGGRASADDLEPASMPEGHAMLIVPGMDPIVLGADVITIGRSEENDIIIEDHQVSRYHARIECAGGVCTVEDLQSSNGSFLNGNPVSRAVLTSGDRLRIGSVDMTYRAPDREVPEAWLEIRGERYPVPASGSTIGRSAENEIRLVDPLASRRHARIEPRQGRQTIIDLDSANGTFVNGQRVQEHVLHDGDEIRIGNSRITFRSQTGT